MRSTASPTISFGLISIPCKTYLAAASENFSFNRITPAGNRTKQKVVDALSGEEVQQTDCLRGYEFEKDKFITFTDEDIDALSGEHSNAIELQEFVDDSAFNPLQVEKCYYLAPDKGGEKSYRLLAATLENLGRVAVGKWYTRGRDHLVVLKPTGKYLTMFQMFYSNEVRAFDYLFSDKSEPSDKELVLAKQLINKLSSKQFDVKKYNDEFAERVRAAIEVRLATGKKVEVKGKSQATGMDMIALLEASLADSKEEKPEAPNEPEVNPELLRMMEDVDSPLPKKVRVKKVK